jgi:Type IV secretion-system coupling protein DNA-binding domain
MARDRDDLLRGQGLLRQGITGARSRWKHYFKLLAGATLIGTIGWPIYTAGFASIETAYHFEQARMGAWIGKETGTEPMMTVFKDGKAYAVRDSEIANDPRYQWLVDQLVHDAMLGGIIGLLIGAAGCGGLAWMMRERGRAAGQDRVICGSVIVDEKALRKMTRRLSDARSLHIATVPLPTNFECRHFALLGTTGAGKTTVLRQMLDGIEARGEPALVYDTSGEFIAHCYRPERGDVILNPFDARSAYWSPFAEIAHPADADRIAHQLVTSTGKEEDDVWLETARILVANILRVLGREGKTTLPDLLDALQAKTKEEMKVWLAGTSSARTFEDDAERATGSVLFMLAKASNLLQFLWREPGDTGSIAFRDFIAGLDNREGAKPWIFVPRKEDYFEAMKPLMACWLECAASATLGLSPSSSRRLWFFLDELADLPRVENLTRLLPEGRKFGAGVVLTFQSIGQMHNRYGRDSAEAILGCCNTKLYLQLVDRDTREWASKTIGDVEVEIRSASDMLEYRDGGGRTSLGTVRHVRSAVLESEMRLEPYHGFLQLPDAYPVARIKLTNAHITARGGARHYAFVKANVDQSLWSNMPVLEAKPAKAPSPLSEPPLSSKGPV